MAAKLRPCERCSKINFQRLFAEADEYFTATFPFIPPWCGRSRCRDTEAWENEMAKPTVLLCEDSQEGHETTTPCSVCWFFRNIREETTHWHMQINGQVSVQKNKPLARTSSSQFFIFCSSLRLISSLFDISKYPAIFEPDSFPPAFIDRSFLTLTPNGRRAAQLQSRQMLPWMCEGFALLRAMPKNETHAGFTDGIWGRMVPEWADMTLARRWLEFCTCHHLQTCCSTGLNDRLLSIQLINCNNRLAVEEHSPATKYTALSYVWAASPEVSRGWPNVVLHAAEATRQLGFQYLWVDRYCIDFSDEEQKQNCIESMHLIFQQAQVTLVAAGNDFDGLPGVRLNNLPSKDNRPRTKQRKVQIGNMSLVSFVDIKDAMKGSNWSYRGWTFQEGLLSKRLLVFTNDQLYWNCCGMSEIESIYIPPELSHLTDFSAQGEWMAPGIFDRISKGSRRSTSTIQYTPIKDTVKRIHAEIWRDIQDYTRRSLKYDFDGLNAFKGAINMHEARSQGNIKFIWGLPMCAIMGFDISSSFAYALASWVSAHPRSQIRRNDFPSWSWVGWRKSVYWKGAFKSISPLSDNFDPQSYDHYAPSIRLLAWSEGQDSGTDVRSAFQSTSGTNTFRILKFLQPYTIQNKPHPKLTHATFRVILSQRELIEVENIPSMSDYEAILCYSEKDNLGLSKLLILKLTDKFHSGERLWERVGIVELRKWNEKMSFNDFIDYIGLARSRSDFLVA